MMMNFSIGFFFLGLLDTSVLSTVGFREKVSACERAQDTDLSG